MGRDAIEQGREGTARSPGSSRATSATRARPRAGPRSSTRPGSRSSRRRDAVPGRRRRPIRPAPGSCPPRSRTGPPQGHDGAAGLPEAAHRRGRRPSPPTTSPAGPSRSRWASGPSPSPTPVRAEAETLDQDRAAPGRDRRPERCAAVSRSGNQANDDFLVLNALLAAGVPVEIELYPGSPPHAAQRERVAHSSSRPTPRRGGARPGLAERSRPA